MLFTWTPVPGTIRPEPGSVRAGDRRAAALGVHRCDVSGRAEAAGDAPSLRRSRRSGSQEREAKPSARELRGRSRRHARPAPGAMTATSLGDAARADPLEQLQRVRDQRAARGRRRIGDDFSVRKRARTGSRTTRLVRGEILGRKGAAALEDPSADLPSDLALVERARIPPLRAARAHRPAPGSERCRPRPGADPPARRSRPPRARGRGSARGS